MPALKNGMLAYCVLTTTVLGVFTITQAISNPSKASFQEIDVQRINVREPDGTLRMVVFSKAAAPGAPVVKTARTGGAEIRLHARLVHR